MEPEFPTPLIIDTLESKITYQVGREMSIWSDELNKKLLITKKRADLVIDFKHFNPDIKGNITKSTDIRKAIDSAYNAKYNE